MTTATSQPGLFAQLEPLLAHRAVLITVSKLEDGPLQVNVCPRQLKESENPALTTPLCVTGTAAELDTDFVSQITQFTALHIGLNSNLTAIEQEIAEAEKAAREAARKKQKTVGNGGRKVADQAASTPSPEPAKSDLEPPRPLSLFDSSPPVEADEPRETVHAAVRAD